MRQIRWYLHPILIFIFSVVALGLSLFLYIYWYVAVSARLQGVVKRYNLDPGQFLELKTWVVILVLSILVAIIMVGIFIIFAFNVKLLRLYQLQHNFINNFTHELKTPVTSIRLYLETFQKHELPRQMQLKYIDYMLINVSRLTDNINSILSLAKLESKLYEMHPVRVDLVETVEQFCRQNSHLFQGCAITIHNPSGRTCPYLVDLPLFEMLLMNLLTNACKYNEAKEPTVAITFIHQDGQLNINIRDNGIGLKRREKKKIFKKFYQGEKTDRNQGEGCGLGLYFADNIVRIHHGRIKAESEGPGQGTTMIITFELNEEADASPGPPRPEPGDSP
ncbi:MAG: HAMP domain-containing histidine kinase [Proteobacteria bacterium]|nr:HAMP domain-containing histidine kinase [Pseudomonadota bacterium]MBU4297309.1 HAMP domain-containing histidine kinase [Pseudomonadota bacterium]MCG2747743.1 HAMP domain-containing histidine kinase [Desulfobulbaceae bacterium]